MWAFRRGGGGTDGNTRVGEYGIDTHGEPPLSGETNGLPNGFSFKPLTIWQLLGAVPVDNWCDYGPCVYSGFNGGWESDPEYRAEECAITGIFAAGLNFVGLDPILEWDWTGLAKDISLERAKQIAKSPAARTLVARRLARARKAAQQMARKKAARWAGGFVAGVVLYNLYDAARSGGQAFGDCVQLH